MEINEAAAEVHDISSTNAQPIEVPDDDEPVITNVIVSKYCLRI